jgi:hypothetical protein
MGGRAAVTPSGPVRTKPNPSKKKYQIRYFCGLSFGKIHKQSTFKKQEFTETTPSLK